MPQASTYASDSYGKKLTRWRMWLNLLAISDHTLDWINMQLNAYRAGHAEALDPNVDHALWAECLPFESVPRNKLYSGSALAMAGHGGDIGAIRSLMGPNRLRIDAADFDRDCVEFCQELYPSAHLHHGDVSDPAHGIQANFFHLDFCGGLSLETITTAAKLVTQNQARGEPLFFGVTMLRGRESKKPKKTPRPTVSRAVRRHQYRNAKKSNKTIDKIGISFLNGDEFVAWNEVEKACQFVREAAAHERAANGTESVLLNRNGTLSKHGTGWSRVRAFLSNLRMCLVSDKEYMRGWTFVGFFDQTYHSKNRHTNGTPFVTFTLGLFPPWICTPWFQEWIHRSFRPNKAFFSSTDACTPKEGFRDDIHGFSQVSATDSLRALQQQIFWLYSHHGWDSGRIALAFDLPPAQVSAWLAHATRGTYGELTPPTFFKALTQSVYRCPLSTAPSSAPTVAYLRRNGETVSVLPGK